MIIEYIREREKREKSFIAFQNSSYSVPTKFIFLFFPLHRSRRKFVFFSSLPFFTSFHHPFSLGDVLLLCWNFDVNRREQLSCYVKTLDAKIMKRKRRDRKGKGLVSIEKKSLQRFVRRCAIVSADDVGAQVWRAVGKRASFWE